jgi:hypothetical protein
MQEIDQAIIAESARWGDAGKWTATSFHRDDHWISAANKTRNVFIKRRREIVLSQLNYAELFSEAIAPIIEVEGEQVLSEELTFTDPFDLLIKNSNQSGTIYYTVDGNDPREIGGGIHASAERSSQDVFVPILVSSVIKSRIIANGNWSPMNVINCLNSNEDFSGLKISEIHYNPLDSVVGTDTISGNSFEFLEFKNTGDHGINLDGLILDSAVYYEFLPGTVLLPGQFYVIASDYVDFFERYGLFACGIFDRNLSNGGEKITLYDKENTELLRFTYNDNSPWPMSPDGFGYSLVAEKSNPEGSPEVYDYWNSSYEIGGSPFADDFNSKTSNVVAEVFKSLRIYPNPARDFIIIDDLSGNNSDQIQLKIYNLSGVQVYASKTTSGARIDLSGVNMTSGVYVAEIRDGNQSRKIKLIIVRD